MPIRLADAAAVISGRSVSEWPAAPGWPTADTLDGLAMDVADGREEATGWFVVRRIPGDVIGDCGWRGGPDAAGVAEIGYGLADPYRHQGYGREAVHALVQWCRRQPGVRQLRARVLPSNAPSRRVLSGAGFVESGYDGEHLLYVADVPPRPSDAGT